jgi:transposase-like protein
MLQPVEAQETEVSSKARRRRFTAEYKRRIVREADASTEPGQVGALLRREGLYSSHLVEWRRLVERQELAALAPKKRGPKVDERDLVIAEQAREIERLTKRAEKAELLVDIQKKVASLLGIPLRNDDGEKR